MSDKRANAKVLWEWKGEFEEHKYKKEIRQSKRYMQKLVNRMASRKGISEKQLMNLHIHIGLTIDKVQYLKKILDIKKDALPLQE